MTEELKNVEMDEMEVEDVYEGEYEVYVEEDSTGKQIAIGAAGTIVGVLILNGVKKGVTWVRNGILKLDDARQLRKQLAEEDEKLVGEERTDE